MTDIALDEKACAQTPMADHIARFWHMIETEAHVRILVEMRRDTSGNRYWDSSSFSNDVAKAIAAERRASPSQVAPADPEQVTDAMVEALNRFERAAMAYERLGKMTRDDEKTRAIRKDAIAELAQSRAALAAAIGTGGQAVAVKPLEWTVSNGDWYAGGYRVHVDLDGSPALYIVSGWHGAGTNPYGTLDEAQAAAQANHDAYIRSCLALSQPHPADERVVEALREALAKVAYVPGDHPIVPVKHDAFLKTIQKIVDDATKEGR